MSSCLLYLTSDEGAFTLQELQAMSLEEGEEAILIDNGDLIIKPLSSEKVDKHILTLWNIKRNPMFGVLFPQSRKWGMRVYDIKDSYNSLKQMDFVYENILHRPFIWGYKRLFYRAWGIFNSIS